MNGVIHNCSHGAGTDHNTRLTEEEMMCKIFNYLDHLIQMMQPQKLLYMAIDGVAPRAKVRCAAPSAPLWRVLSAVTVPPRLPCHGQEILPCLLPSCACNPLKRRQCRIRVASVSPARAVALCLPLLHRPCCRDNFSPLNHR